ncbi:MAG: heparinase II/III family protein, partial [Bacteroidota bacterium]
MPERTGDPFGRVTRRRFLLTSCVAGAGALAVPGRDIVAGILPGDGRGTGPIPGHPRIYLTGKKINGLRSLDEVRKSVTTGHSHDLWKRILAGANADIDAGPLVPSSVFPGRDLPAAKHDNPDWTICNAAGQRILRAALVNLLTGEETYKKIALHQMDALFDDAQWPEWLDKAHRRFGHPAGLRTGMLAHDIALSYDWLYSSLTAPEREFVLEGLDRKGIHPYLTSLEQDPWWTHDMNNWLTVIVGGFGIVGMALGDDHPHSRKLIEYSTPLMQKYLETYGPEGEFNESVAYANATKLPAAYYLARRYWSGGGENPLTKPPFPQTCEWTIYFTLPPGRVAAFGDSGTNAPVEVKHFAAVASATRAGIYQWFYQTHAPSGADPVEFLWHDPSVEPTDPTKILPLGRTFSAHGANFSSRTDWNPAITACVVYGKAGREENHEHNDIGQVCIDGYGERLIVDLGSPSGYPADFFEENRWEYYNASARGHNLLMFGGREMRTLPHQRGKQKDPRSREMQGRILSSHFDDVLGGHWLIDATGAYDDVKRVRRALVHLLPGIVAVLDEADLRETREISLRWHTNDRAEPDLSGAFTSQGESSRIVGRVIRLD